MRRVPFQPYDPTEEPKGRSTPGAKRKPPRAGRRSVTTLTAAQLERKRANDREAQRTTRQRTKDYIDQLEHQVADLQGAYQDPESKLMEVVHRNNELRSENAMLKGKLSHALWALDHYVTSTVKDAPSTVRTKPAMVFTASSASPPTAGRAPSVAAFRQRSTIICQHEHWHPSGLYSPAASEPIEVSVSTGAEPTRTHETKPGGLHAQQLLVQTYPLRTTPMPLYAADVREVKGVPQGHMNYCMLDANPASSPQPQEYPPSHQQHLSSAEYPYQESVAV